MFDATTSIARDAAFSPDCAVTSVPLILMSSSLRSVPARRAFWAAGLR
jgi:hypothetical protein